MLNQGIRGFALSNHVFMYLMKTTSPPRLKTGTCLSFLIKWQMTEMMKKKMQEC